MFLLRSILWELARHITINLMHNKLHLEDVIHYILCDKIEANPEKKIKMGQNMRNV